MSGWVAGATVVGSLVGANASSKAAKTQAASTDRAADLEREMFERNIELNAPFREAGITALNKLVPLATEYTPFSYNEFTKDPGYAFRMSEGMKGLERSAAARGGLLSGGTLKGIQRYGQDLASQEYQNAFDRYGVERDRRLNPLQSLAGVGQTTSQQLGSAGTQMAGNVGNLMTSGAAARASGYVGGANALNQGLSQYLNYSQGQNMINAMRRPGFTGGGSGYMTDSPYNFSGISEYG